MRVPPFFSLLILVVLCSLSVNAQDTNTPETEVKQVIITFFEGFHQGDVESMKALLRSPEDALETAFKTPDGSFKVGTQTMQKLLYAIANRPKEARWEEKLLDFKIQVDGSLAHVWTPYEFWFNGKLSHCGANAFTLAKIGSDWKILHLIDSRRSDCN